MGVITEYTSPNKKYNCSCGTVSGKPKLPASIAFSLSFSVFTKNVFFKWYIISGLRRSISAATPAHPSIIMYVMKNNALLETASPINPGIL